MSRPLDHALNGGAFVLVERWRTADTRLDELRESVAGVDLDLIELVAPGCDRPHDRVAPVGRHERLQHDGVIGTVLASDRERPGAGRHISVEPEDRNVGAVAGVVALRVPATVDHSRRPPGLPRQEAEHHLDRRVGPGGLGFRASHDRVGDHMGAGDDVAAADQEAVADHFLRAGPADADEARLCVFQPLSRSRHSRSR
jgi:hypothetical protein